jgi:polysaccharide export outer membrane protein
MPIAPAIVMRRILAVTLSQLTLALTLAAPCSPQSAQPGGAEERPAAYVIGPEDVLDIAVWNNVAISRTVPVRPDGKISLPLLNDVQAEGLTPVQLRETLARALTVFMPRPEISVIVREVHSVKVTVIGQVKTPGRYELKSRATVLDVLAMAGGLTDYAARGSIVVLRQEGGATRQIPFLFDKLKAKAGPKNDGQENFCVAGGDIILVP